MWSTLLADRTSPPRTYNEQAWHSFNAVRSKQYKLTSNTLPVETIEPEFSTVDLSPATSTPGVQVTNDPTNGATVTLTQQSTGTPSYTGTFTASGTTSVDSRSTISSRTLRRAMSWISIPRQPVPTPNWTSRSR